MHVEFIDDLPSDWLGLQSHPFFPVSNRVEQLVVDDLKWDVALLELLLREHGHVLLGFLYLVDLVYHLLLPLLSLDEEIDTLDPGLNTLQVPLLLLLEALLGGHQGALLLGQLLEVIAHVHCSQLFLGSRLVWPILFPDVVELEQFVLKFIHGPVFEHYVIGSTLGHCLELLCYLTLNTVLPRPLNVGYLHLDAFLGLFGSILALSSQLECVVVFNE